VTTDPAELETGHFRRPPVDGQPTSELLINLEASSLESMNISWDVERPTSTTSHQLESGQKEIFDGSATVSPLTTLGGTPLASLATSPRIAHIPAAVAELAELQARSESRLIEAGFFVTVNCTTTFQAAQNVIRPNTLVNMRGLGGRHSGPYFCSAVRHIVSQDRHRMDIELIRNGWNDNA
jgi:hypothetical protein